MKGAVKNKVGLVGRKVGMTQLFSDRGEQVPVTVIKAGPCVVVGKRLPGKDGYAALQIGFEEISKKKGLKKPAAGLFKKKEVAPQRVLREIRDMDPEAFEIGQALKADLFAIGEMVSVQGTSKGRGFSGGVKRHGYGGGRATHGSMFHRAPGSIGASSYPSRVWKGKKLPGQYGNVRVTVRGLRIVGIDMDRGLLLVRGAVPGANRGLVLITAERD